MTHSNSRTADESRADNIAKLGSDLGEVYSALWQQLSWLHKKWGHYVELFGTSPERIDLLNDTAPTFFRTVQDSLLEDVFLNIARLTDPPKSMGKENLSFKRLPALLTIAALRDEVDAKLLTLATATEFARDWRNRKLAHGDLALALSRVTTPLAPASRAHVKDALEAMGNVLNAIALHFFGSTTMFEFAGEPSAGGGGSLLHYLQAGKEAEQQRRDRLRLGLQTPEDLVRRTI